MEPRSLDYIARACGGELKQGPGERLIHRISTDSRRLEAGDLFFAIRGENFDGHDFLVQAAQKQAAAVVAEWGPVPHHPLGCAIIVVANTRLALGRLAARYRTDFALPIIAVGGSNGKTTTKELIASVLRQKFNTLWSESSFNNDIGVPLTLLKLEKVHEAAVLEAGTNHPGELAPLVNMMQPRFGVITTIGREHLEYFGDLQGVAQEEGWLAELLPTEGKLFINGDNPWTSAIQERTRAAVVRCGVGAENDWRATRVWLEPAGVRFEVAAPQNAYDGEYRLQLLGRHQATNALLAISIGAALGLSPDQVRRGLGECKPARMRMQVFEAGGVTVLDDAYNANADSMQMALQTLQDYPIRGRRLAVLGTMAELGAHSAAAHAEAGRCAAQIGVAHLLAVGEWASRLGAGAREAGLTNVTEVAEVEEALEALKILLEPGDVVLLKASRAAAFERIAAGLKEM